MQIHHATAKKAAENNIALEIIEGATPELDFARAIVEGDKRKGLLKQIEARDPKEALKAAMLQKTFMAEYPALSIVCSTAGLQVWHTVDQNPTEISPLSPNNWDAVPTLAEILDRCQELGLDPEVGYDPDKNRPCAPLEKYKNVYAERGNRDHCGDWLATFLKSRKDLVDADGAFDVVAFEALLKENGVDMDGKWAKCLHDENYRSHGWKGRFRMHGRQKLELIVARVGHVVINGDTFDAPIEALEALLEKHPNVEAEWEE